MINFKAADKDRKLKKSTKFKNIPIQQIDFSRMTSDIFFKEITVPQLL